MGSTASPSVTVEAQFDGTSYTEIGQRSSVSISGVEKGVYDFTHFDSTAVTAIPTGINDYGSLGVETFFDVDTTSSHGKLLDHIEDDVTDISWRVTWDGSGGSKTFTFDGHASGYSVDAGSTTDGVTASYEVKINSKPVRA